MYEPQVASVKFYELCDIENIKDDDVLRLGKIFELLRYRGTMRKEAMENLASSGIDIVTILNSKGTFRMYGITKDNYLKALDAKILVKRKLPWELPEELHYQSNGYQALHAVEEAKQLLERVAAPKLLVSNVIAESSTFQSNSHIRYPSAEYSKRAYNYFCKAIKENYPRANLPLDELKSISQFKYIIQRFNTQSPDVSIFQYIDTIMAKWNDACNYLYANHDISVSAYNPNIGVMLKFSKEIIGWYTGVNHD